MNLSLARVYLNGADPKLATRTWQHVMENIVAKKKDETRRRWEVAIKDRTICFTRKKLKSRGTNLKPTLFRFSAEIEALLKRRPAAGPLFPYLCTVRAGDRATEFKQRCDGLGITAPLLLVR